MGLGRGAHTLAMDWISASRVLVSPVTAALNELALTSHSSASEICESRRDATVRRRERTQRCRFRAGW